MQFPKWVNEVNEVPDFSWIGKTFSVIDDDFVKVNDTIEGLRGKFGLILNNFRKMLKQNISTAQLRLRMTSLI